MTADQDKKDSIWQLDNKIILEIDIFILIFCKNGRKNITFLTKPPYFIFHWSGGRNKK